jgi:anaerobic magnesium-protoporphyrin IX monomethyl ester cyclase
VDFVIFGEGEFTLVDLTDALQAGTTDFRGILGLGFKGEHGPTVNDPRPLAANLDEIVHADYSLVDYSKYGHVIGNAGANLAIESSRGCPFGCSFCDIRRTKYRYHTPVFVVDVIEGLYRKGVRSFFFVDDNLPVIKERANEICRLIVERGLKIDFKVSSRVDTVNEEMLANLKRAGCSRLSLGIESSQQKNLDFMGKGIKEEQIVGTLQAARKVGLPVFAYMMIGFPDQTRHEMLKEVDFLKRHKVDYTNFSILTVYPKTKLYEQALENGWLEHDPWPEFARNPGVNIEAPRINRRYSREQLEAIQHDMIRRFYVNPRMILRQIAQLNSWDELVGRARIGLKMLEKAGGKGRPASRSRNDG